MRLHLEAELAVLAVDLLLVALHQVTLDNLGVFKLKGSLDRAVTRLGLVHSDDVASAVLSRLNSIENNAFAVKLCIGVTDIVSACAANELALKSYVLLKS